MCAASLLSGPATGAEPARTDPATAQALFDEARTLMRSGQYAAACPKLEESQRLDPGLGTLINLADCWQRLGRSASAWSKFVEVADAARAAGDLERERIARTRADALEPKLSRLQLDVPDSARVPGLTIMRNEIPVGVAQWNSAVPVDPGEHVVRVSAPGHQSWQQVIAVGANAARQRLVIPVLVRETTPVQAESPAPVAPVPAGPPADDRAHESSWMTTAGFITGAAGVVAIGTGTYFGIRAIRLHKRSNDEGCDANDFCPEPARQTRSDARSAGNTSTVAFVLGGALLAGGAALYLVGSADERAPAVRVNAALGQVSGVAVSGRF